MIRQSEAGAIEAVELVMEEYALGPGAELSMGE